MNSLYFWTGIVIIEMLFLINGCQCQYIELSFAEGETYQSFFSTNRAVPLISMAQN